MSIHTPLNDDDITRKVGCRFILYENMHNVKNINELLPRTLILYELARVGHFCCVFENSEGINFFDPLGMFPDKELKMADPAYVQSMHHDFSYLDKLLSETNKSVIYNQYKLQSHHTSTCGHWCGVRMICSEIHCDDFKKCFNGVKDRDSLIVKIYNSF